MTTENCIRIESETLLGDTHKTHFVDYVSTVVAADGKPVTATENLRSVRDIHEAHKIAREYADKFGLRVMIDPR
jgi:hypothetical protein